MAPTGLSLSRATTLIKHYSALGLLDHARKVFEEMPDKDVVAWTAMISSYTTNSLHEEAFSTFRAMMLAGVFPNAFTLSTTIKSCRELGSLAAALHGLAVKLGVDMQTYVENTLLDAYVGRNVDDARKVFDEIQDKTAASWATMIAGYTRRGDGHAGIKMFLQMLQEGVELHPFTCSIGVRACASIGYVCLGKQLHAATIKSGLNLNLPVSNSLLDMYCRCMNLLGANQIFKDMHLKDLITWNTMIAGFERSHSCEALELFISMVYDEVYPNSFTYTSVISACANLAILSCGQQVHGTMFQRGFGDNHEISNSLIDMYAKCGSIIDAEKTFDEMHSKSLLSWTSLVTGYGINGYGREAIALFSRMINSGIQPDNVVFIAVINACSHAGLIEEGLKYFKQMREKYNVIPSKEVYGCSVDLLGRAGRLTEAYDLIKTMHFEPDESIWGALLGACKMHNNMSLGRVAAENTLELNPGEGKTYIMLSNLYAAGCDWEEFAGTRKLFRGMGSQKAAGRSWIQVREELCSFVAGDRKNPHITLISKVLEILFLHMDESDEEINSGGLLQILEGIT